MVNACPAAAAGAHIHTYTHLIHAYIETRNTCLGAAELGGLHLRHDGRAVVATQLSVCLGWWVDRSDRCQERVVQKTR